MELTMEAGVPGDVIYRDGNRYSYVFVGETMRVFNSSFENVKNIFRWSKDNLGGINAYSNGKKQRIKNGQIMDERPAPD